MRNKILPIVKKLFIFIYRIFKDGIAELSIKNGNVNFNFNMKEFATALN